MYIRKYPSTPSSAGLTSSAAFAPVALRSCAGTLISPQKALPQLHNPTFQPYNRRYPNLISNQQNVSSEFKSIASGSRFTCGVLKSSNRVTCRGTTLIASDLETQFQNKSMADINAGEGFAWRIYTTGFVICKASNENGELEVPFNSAYEYIGLALGLNHSCTIRRVN